MISDSKQKIVSVSVCSVAFFFCYQTYFLAPASSKTEMHVLEIIPEVA